MVVKRYLEKMELLINNMFEGKFVLDQHHLKKLMKLLENRDENSPGKLLLDTPSFSDLICQSLDSINNASTPIKVFLIEIVTMLFKNELQFTKMQMQGFQKFSSEFCIHGNLNSDAPINLHLACIKLATVQVTHCSGLSILIEHKVWRHVLYPNIHHRTKQISDAAYNFMAKLVWKLNEYNIEQELMEVLAHILEPILSSEYLSIPVLDTETDTKLADKIYPYISTLLAILTEADNYAPSNKAMSLLKDYFIVDHRLFEIFGASKNLHLLKLLNSCLFRYVFGILRNLLFIKEVDDFCNKMAAFHRNYIVHCVKKREAIIIVDFVIQSNIILSHFMKTHGTEINYPLTFERNGKKYEFSLQVLVHLLMPMLKYGALQRIARDFQMTDEIEQFIVKIGRTVTDYIITSCYLFSDYLEEVCDTYRKQVTIHTLKELLRLKGHITEAQVGHIFQTLYYLLEIFILCDETGRLVELENPMNGDVLRLLTHLLDAMKMLLKEHNIPWYDNLEIVNIQPNLLNLLKQNFLTTKQVVQVLDLINICVNKFLSPNMSLLVESRCTRDNTLSEIGKAIKLYSLHEDWEIRDSAFNLLNSCTEICFIKYIPLQKMIRDYNLIIDHAMKAALTDPEFYSQCTALKCLTAATKIDIIWQEILVNNADIHLQLVYIVKNHGEGMVRKEAVNVLTGVYTNQKVAPMFQNTLYDVMLAAAIDDLHWEVQLAALNFWKNAMHKHLTYRGMCDGKFPPVTFSKEKRKIIVLNNSEIQRQLTAIMNHLSSVGCLTVLIECMNEIHNIEVMDQAYCIAKDLVDMLNTYKFQKVIESVKIEPDDKPPQYMEQTNMPMDLSRGSEEERNKVIDSILNVNQSELIINLHENYSRIKFEEMDVDLALIPRRELVHANEFLETFKSKDYSLLIEDKKKFGKCFLTLDGLLDEMLGL